MLLSAGWPPACILRGSAGQASRFWERGNSSEDEEEDGSTSSSRTNETFESNSDEASSDASTSSESNLGRGKSKYVFV